jgi:hypothetical protein
MRLRNACNILIRKSEGKRTLGRSERKWVDNSKINLKEIVCKNVTEFIWLLWVLWRTFGLSGWLLRTVEKRYLKKYVILLMCSSCKVTWLFLERTNMVNIITLWSRLLVAVAVIRDTSK